MNGLSSGLVSDWDKDSDDRDVDCRYSPVLLELAIYHLIRPRWPAPAPLAAASFLDSVSDRTCRLYLGSGRLAAVDCRRNKTVLMTDYDSGMKWALSTPISSAIAPVKRLTDLSTHSRFCSVCRANRSRGFFFVSV